MLLDRMDFCWILLDSWQSGAHQAWKILEHHAITEQHLKPL